MRYLYIKIEIGWFKLNIGGQQGGPVLTVFVVVFSVKMSSEIILFSVKMSSEIILITCNKLQFLFFRPRC